MTAFTQTRVICIPTRKAALVVFVTVAFLSNDLWGQSSFTWNSSSSGDWGNSTKWAGGAAPSGNANIFFNVTSSGGAVTATNNLTLTSVTGLTVNSTNNRTITLLGNGFTLDGNINMLNSSRIFNIGSSSQNMGNITLSRNISITTNETSTINFNGNLTDSTSNYNINKLGGGLLTFNATVDISGILSVSNGTVRLGATEGVAAGSISSAASLSLSGPGRFDLNEGTQTFASLSGTGGNITLGAGTLTINQASDSVFSGIISEGGSFVKTGSGTLTLNGSNTYTGSTTISGGTLQIGNDGTTGNLSTSSSITNNGDLVFRRSNEISQGTNFANAISGSGNLTQSGSGNLILASGNTYTGVTTLNSGTLSFSAIANGGLASAIGQSSSNAGNLVLNGGTLRYTGSSDQTDRGFTVGSGGASLEVNSAGATLRFTGGVSGTGLLTKTGAGTLELVGNTIAGPVTVSAGALAGNPTINGLVTLNSGASLVPGDGVGGFGTLTAGAGLTLNSGGNVLMDISNTSGSSDSIAVSGSLIYGGTLALNISGMMPSGVFTNTYNLFTGSAGSGDFSSVTLAGSYSGSFTQVSANTWQRNTGDGTLWTFSESTGTLTVIPEPSTWALLVFGTGFVLWRVRRCQRAQK